MSFKTTQSISNASKTTTANDIQDERRCRTSMLLCSVTQPLTRETVSGERNSAPIPRPQITSSLCFPFSLGFQYIQRIRIVLMVFCEVWLLTFKISPNTTDGPLQLGPTCTLFKPQNGILHSPTTTLKSTNSSMFSYKYLYIRDLFSETLAIRNRCSFFPKI